MPIDWFTVVAQAINFLILVWLLKRFLYKPILDAIDERERGIAAQLAQAEAKKAEAQKERDDFQHKNDIFGQERASLLKIAVDEANAERQRLLDEARKDADILRAKREEALRSEQPNLNQEITRWTQKEVFAITRKTLADLAATGLEERMAEVFVGRLRALTGVAKGRLASAFRASTQPAKVRAFDLPAAQRSDPKRLSRKLSVPNYKFNSRLHPSWSAASSFPPADKKSHGASRIIWRHCKRAPANFCTKRYCPEAQVERKIRSPGGSQARSEWQTERRT